MMGGRKGEKEGKRGAPPGVRIGSAIRIWCHSPARHN